MKVESFAVEEVYGDADAPVCPYRLITEQESLVYRTLLPKETTIEMYKSGPIPLRILQIGAHAVEVLSCKLLIWHPEDAREKDPVLIGRMGDRGDMYLLARWGEELEEFQVLATKAKVKLAAVRRIAMDIDHYAYVLLDNPEYLSGINRVIHFLGNAYLFSPSMEDKNRLIGEALRDICGEAMDAVLKIEQNWKEEVRDER